MSALSEELGLATGRGEFELHFQPVIDLDTAEPTGMEALLRWAHPTRGLLWPADFLGEAEEAGLGATLGAWVLSRALNQSRHVAPTLPLWINASAADLADPRYPARVGQALRAVAGGCRLGIDLPEQALRALGDRAAEVCAQLRAAGVELALEHDGADDTITSRLAELGLGAVKIGRALVRGIDGAHSGAVARRERVAALVAAARAAGAVVIAGGVESWAEARCLQELGVDRAFGFLLAPPMRADRVRWALGRGDAGRGSYVNDGAGWLQSGSLSVQLHDALPQRTNPEATRRGVLAAPSFGSLSGPVPELAPVAIPAQRKASVPTGNTMANPFGRFTARPAAPRG